MAVSSFGLSPEVGVCSFARFYGEFLQAGPSVPDPALLEAAADGPETLPHEGGRTICFSALGMVQCCKVSTGLGGWHGAGGQDGSETRAPAQSVLKGGWPLSLFIKYSGCPLSKCCLHWQLQPHSTSSQPGRQEFGSMT